MATILTFVVSPCHAVIELNLTLKQWQNTNILTPANPAGSTLFADQGKAREEGGNLLFTTDGSNPFLVLTLYKASFDTKAGASNEGTCDQCPGDGEAQRWTCRTRT